MKNATRLCLSGAAALIVTMISATHVSAHSWDQDGPPGQFWNSPVPLNHNFDSGSLDDGAWQTQFFHARMRGCFVPPPSDPGQAPMIRNGTALPPPCDHWDHGMHDEMGQYDHPAPPPAGPCMWRREGDAGQGMPMMNMGDMSAPSSRAYADADRKMHHDMMLPYSGDADQDFLTHMIPHHQGAIDMANIELQYGHDPEARRLAEKIIHTQTEEIADMQAMLQHERSPDSTPETPPEPPPIPHHRHHGGIKAAPPPAPAALGDGVSTTTPPAPPPPAAKP